MDLARVIERACQAVLKRVHPRAAERIDQAFVRTFIFFVLRQPFGTANEFGAIYVFSRLVPQANDVGTVKVWENIIFDPVGTIVNLFQRIAWILVYTLGVYLLTDAFPFSV